MTEQGWGLSREEKVARLLQARDFVLSIPSDEFYIEHWWLPEGLAYDDWNNEYHRVRDNKCGCPIGHMCQKGMFGLAPEDYGNPRQRVFVIVGDVFGIPFTLAQFMFDQYMYQRPVTKQQVARRIEYVAGEIADG